MKYNYHTHTWRCGHAEGKEREYIEAAIKAGLLTLGFSDHAPYFFPQEARDYYSCFRMTPTRAEDYCNTILQLKEEYKDQIEIRLGVEIEYYPKSFDKTYEFLKKLGVEYFILGQHFTRNEYDAGAVYSGSPTKERKNLSEYIDTVIAQMKSGRFLYIAHPDIIHFIPQNDDDLQFYNENMEKLCKTSLKTGVPLEFNLLGAADHRQYPSQRFLDIAGKTGCPLTIGIDAHSPERITQADFVIDEWMPVLNEAGVKLSDKKLI